MGKHLKKAERRKQIIDAAIKAFGSRGYHETQVSHIVQEANVARGTFYLYFSSKREIFEVIIQFISQRFLSEIKPIDKVEIENIPSQIIGNIHRAVEIMLENPAYIKIFFNDAVGLDDEFDQRLRKFYLDVLGYIRTGLENGQKMGVIREGDPQTLALFLLGCLKEAFYQHVLGIQKIDPKKIVQEVFQFVLHGVVHPDLIRPMLDGSKLQPATSI